MQGYNRKMTATKAWWSSAATAVATLGFYWLNTQYGFGEEVTEAEAFDAVEALITSVATGAIAWVATYFPSNKPKN